MPEPHSHGTDGMPVYPSQDDPTAGGTDAVGSDAPVGTGLPSASVADAGKTVVVDDAGAYALGEASGASVPFDATFATGTLGATGWSLADAGKSYGIEIDTTSPVLPHPNLAPVTFDTAYLADDGSSVALSGPITTNSLVDVDVDRVTPKQRGLWQVFAEVDFSAPLTAPASWSLTGGGGQVGGWLPIGADGLNYAALMALGGGPVQIKIKAATADGAITASWGALILAPVLLVPTT